MSKPAAGTALDTGNSLYTGITNVWAFLEGSGSTSADSKAGNTATLSGGVTWASDANGPYLSCSGASGAATLGTEALYPTGFTSGAWSIAFGGACSSGTNEYILGSLTNGTYISMVTGSNLDWHPIGGHQFSEVISFTSDANYVIAADGSGNVSLYVNGIFIATHTYSDSRFALDTIGAVGTGLFFQGRVDYVYVWGARTLSSGDASTLNSNPYGIFGTVASAAITEQNLPANHAGNITVHAVGSGTSWTSSTTWTPSGVSGWTVASKTQVDGTHYTIVLTPPTAATPPVGATGTLTLTEGVTGSTTATTTVGTPTLAISPTTGGISTTPTLTVTGANTLWSSETAAGLFTVTGGTGASLATPTVSTNTAATDVLTVGTGAGTLTIKDVSTGATASFTATSGIAYTSIASGNWATSTNWTPTGVPGNNDTVIIDHAITITSDTTIGTGTATTVVTVGTTSSSLTVTGCKLTIKGNVSLGAYNGGNVLDYLILNPSGSTQGGIEFDGNSGVSPVVTTTYDCRCVSNGTSSGNCYVRTKSGSAGNNAAFTVSGGVSRSGFWLATYTNFTRLGTAGTSGIYSNIVAGGTGFTNPTHFTASFDNCVFDHCGRTPDLTVESGTNGGGIWSFTNCTWSNSLETDITGRGCMSVNTSPYAISGIGVRTITDSLFLSRPILDGPRDFSITNSYFDDGIGSAASCLPWALFDGNMLRFTTMDELILGGGQSNCYLYGDPSWTGAGLILTSEYGNNTDNGANGTGGNITGNIAEWAGTTGSGQDGFYAWGETEGTPPTTDRPTIFHNNIVFTSGSGSMRLAALNSNTAQMFKNLSTIEHNTIVVNGGDALSGASTTGIQANSIVHCRSNILYNLGSSTGIYAFHDTDSSPTLNSVAAGAITNNCWKDFAAQPANYWIFPGGTSPVIGATTCSDGTVYLAPMSGSTAPGASDVLNTDPDFVDITRNLAGWSTFMGGPGTAADAIARIQADPTLTKSSLIPWVQAGYAPTNVAVHNTAHDGGDIGAVAYTPGGATAYTLTAPGTAKGNVTVASGNFTVQCNGTPGSPVTITPSGGGTGGTFTPSSLTIFDSSAHTFTYTPRLVGMHAISCTNNSGLTDPASVNYLGMVQLGSSGTADSGNTSPSLGGQNLFANGTWLPEFTRDITGDSIDPGSAALIALYGSSNLHVDFRKTDGTSGVGLIGIPFNVVPGTQSVKPVTWTVYPSANPPDSSHPSDTGGASPPNGQVPILTTGSFEGFYNGPGVPPTTDGPGDQHCITLIRNETTGLVDTIWESETTWTTNSGTSWNAHGGAQFNIATGAQRPDDVSTAEAGGMCIFLGLLRYDEVQAVIDGIQTDIGHAIRYTAPFDQNTYVWPGRCTVADGSAPSAPMGSRLRISASWYTTNASSYTGQARVIIDAMRKYGLTLADITGGGYGLGPFVCGVSDDRWDSDATTHGIYALGNIPTSALEAIQYIPGWTFTGPISGSSGTPYTFTVARYPVVGPSNYDTNIYLFANGSNTGWSTTAIELKDANPSGTATFTPPSDGIYTLHTMTGGQEWYPASDITFTVGTPSTSYTLTAPSPATGQVGVASNNFTITPNGFFTGNITPNDGGNGGTFTPTSLSWAADASAKTFTYTAASVGTKTIAATNNGGLTDPGSVSFIAYNLTLAPSSQAVANSAAAILIATLTGGSGSLVASTTAGTLSTTTPTSGTPFTLTVSSSGSGTDVVTVTGPGGTSKNANVAYPVPPGQPGSLMMMGMGN